MAQQMRLSKPGVSAVDIHAADVEGTATNQLIKIALPISKSRQLAGAGPTMKIYNFIRYTHVLKVKGMLVSETGSTALQKKNALMSLTPGSLGMFYTAGAITMTYRTETYVGHIENVRWVDSATRQDRADSGEADKYDIEFLFIIGEE